MKLRFALSTFVLLSSLLVAAAPPAALAQQGGLPALQAKIDALQAQISALATLQTQVNALRVQINTLAPPVADAINGTWSGRVLSTQQFSLPFEVFQIDTGGAPTLNNFVHIPIVNALNCAVNSTTNPPTLSACSLAMGAMNVRFAPGALDSVLASETSDITLQLTGTGKTVTGSVLSPDGAAFGAVDGIAVSNNFFLLRIVATSDDPTCPVLHFEGSASIAADDPKLLVFTGSGGSRCGRQLFSGGFRRP